VTTELFANNASTTVTSGGGSTPAAGTAESWIVQDASSFPEASSGVSQFRLVDRAAPSEQMIVTNTSGNTWTVTRGAEGTTPVAHAPGFTVWADVTAAVFETFPQSGEYVPASGGDVDGDLAVAGNLSTGGFSLPIIAPSTRPPAWSAASWSQQFQTGHGWTTNGTGIASANLNDTTSGDYCRGTQAVTVTTTGTGGQANVRKLAGTVPDLTGKAIRIILKVEDITHLRAGGVNLFVGTSGLGNTFKWRLNMADATSMLVTSGDWVVLTANWANLDSAAGSFSISSTGVPSQTSGFTDMQLQIVDDGSGPVTFHLQAIEIIPATSATFPQGVVSVVFDDSYQSVYDLARPVMDALGYCGTLYTIAEAIGGSGNLTLDELNQMQDQSGWEVAGHAYTSAAHAARYPNLTAAQVDSDLRNLRAWLVTNGFRGDSLAYPGGNFEPTTDGVEVDAIAARYFSSGRTILNVIEAGTNYGNAESYPPPMPWRLRAVEPVTSIITGAPNVTNLLAAGSTLDKVANNGGWLILVFHEIVTTTPTDTIQIEQSDFSTLMNGIASRNLPVMPAGDVLRYA
jgi:hypothetical protein